MKHGLVFVTDVFLLIGWLCIFWLTQFVKVIQVVVLWVEVGEQLLIELVPHQPVRLLVAELSQVVIEDIVLSVQSRIPILLFLLFQVESVAIQGSSVLLLEVSRQEHLVVVLGSLLSTTNEAEKRLLLLHRDGKDAATSLKMVLELLVKMKR